MTPRHSPLPALLLALTFAPAAPADPGLPLDVTPPRPQGRVRLAVSLSNSRPLPGEDVDLYVDLLIRRGPLALGNRVHRHLPVRDVFLTVPTLDDTPALRPLRPLEQVVREHLVPPGHHGFRINNIPGEMLLEHEPPGGLPDLRDTPWYRRRLTIPFRVRRAGQVVIPPARVVGQVYLTPTLPGGRGRWEGFTAASTSLTLTIADLPGRPGNDPGATAPAQPPIRVAQASTAPDAVPKVAPAWPTVALAALPWAALTLVALPLLVLLVRRARRRGRSRRRPRDNAGPTIASIRRRLRAPRPSAADVRRAAHDFLRAHLALPAGEVTPADAEQRLTEAGHDPALVRRWCELLGACEAAEFAPGVTTCSAADLAAAADALVRATLDARPRPAPPRAPAGDGLAREREAALAGG